MLERFSVLCFASAPQRRMIHYCPLLLMMPLICLAAPPDISGPDSLIIDSLQSVEVDSSRVLSDGYGDRETWEKIVSLPGDLVYVPIWLVLKGTSELVSYSYESKLVERVTDFVTSDDGKRGLRPQYSSRTGAGLKYFHKDFIRRGSRMYIGASAGPALRQGYYWRARNLSLSVLDLAALADYRLLPTERFYGLGPQTTDEENTTFAYSHERTLLQLALGRRWRENFRIEVVPGIEINSILRGKDSRFQSLTCDVVEEKLTEAYGSGQDVEGRETGLRLLKTEARLEFDNRVFVGDSVGGLVAAVSYAVYRESGGSGRHNFSRLEADIQKFVHLFYGRALALRVRGEFAGPASDGDAIPFYYLSEIGRQETVRGFQRGRFRDRQMIMGSAEYQFPVRRRPNSDLRMHLFVDGGKVGPAEIFSDLTEDLQITYGMGLRAFNEEGQLTGLEIGFSDDGFRIIFQLN